MLKQGIAGGSCKCGYFQVVSLQNQIFSCINKDIWTIHFKPEYRRFSINSRFCGTIFDVPQKKQQVTRLETETARQDFWDDQKNASTMLQKIEFFRKQIGEYESLERDVLSVSELIEIADEGDNLEITDFLSEIERRAHQLERYLLFSGKYDDHNAMISIHSGAGGVDAQDWAEMLLRMYLRWCERETFSVSIIDESRGQEAGVKSVTFEIRGQYAYGRLLGEAGVHRLVRLSPFNADNLRQTSFALVEVMPVIEHSSEISLNESDLRMDTYRSSGAGGQNVNKTESAVRITHIPTGLSVSCQTERSQIQNRERALSMIKAKLLQKMIDEQEQKNRELRGEHISAGWGNQIRSYVLHPYQMIKDHRTAFETSSTQIFLDGGIDDALEAYLRWKAERKA